MKRYLIIALSLLLLSAGTMNAQKVAVKTNALYWASATPNAAFEFAMADRWTFEVSGGYNPWTFNKEKNTKMKHFLVSPEFRYWFCESFQGHFIGVNANYTQFNMAGIPVPKVFVDLGPGDSSATDLKNTRIQGWAVGAGLTYGYAFPIARRWNMEFTLGYGWWYTEYDQFESRECGIFQQSVCKHVLGPTALGVSFIYMIK